MKYRSTLPFICVLGLAACLGCAPKNPSATSTPASLGTTSAPATPGQAVSPVAGAAESGTPGVMTSMTPDAGASPGMTASPGADGTPNTNSNVPVIEGVSVTVHKAGSGAAIKSGESGQFHYTGWLEKFDAASAFDTSRGKDPLSVQLGRGMVIPGWDQGLVGMQPGEVRRLVIGPEMAYGASGAGGVIPPNATLYFEVEYVGPAK